MVVKVSPCMRSHARMGIGGRTEERTNERCSAYCLRLHGLVTQVALWKDGLDVRLCRACARCRGWYGWVSVWSSIACVAQTREWCLEWLCIWVTFTA